MCFNLQYGHLSDITFEHYEKEKESGVQTMKWGDWLKQNIGISSTYSRKLRVISRLLRPYVNRFSTVGLPFIEIYSMRKELQEMFSSSEEIRQYWSSQIQHALCVETQSSQ
jgi:superfamily I DNA/RNA helicase